MTFLDYILFINYNLNNLLITNIPSHPTHNHQTTAMITSPDRQHQHHLTTAANITTTTQRPPKNQIQSRVVLQPGCDAAPRLLPTHQTTNINTTSPPQPISQSPPPKDHQKIRSCYRTTSLRCCAMTTTNSPDHQHHHHLQHIFLVGRGYDSMSQHY